jgi:deoxycytidine triphosphate deaminase
MLLNANQVEQMLITNGKGKKAQVGYDLTVTDVKSIRGGMLFADKTVLDRYDEVKLTTVEKAQGDERNVWVLTPGVYSVTFEQGCKLDDKTTAFIRQRSSILRMGGTVTSGVYDPGFEVDQMGGVMTLTKTVVLEHGARLAQIIMFENNSAELYDGQWQKDKDVK